MKLRTPLFVALVVGAMLPAVPASAAPLTAVTVTTATPIVTTSLLGSGLKVQAIVRAISPSPLAATVTTALPPLPNVPVEIVIAGVKKSGNTNPTTGIYEAKFTASDFGETPPSGPVNVRATAYPSLSSVTAQDTSVTSVGHATLLFDTALPPSGLVEQIDSGASHTCALTTDTGVRCWGSGTLGQIGNDTATDANSARSVRDGAGTLTGIIAIDAGTKHTCALNAAAEVWCWGSNTHEQLGAPLSGPTSTVAVKADLPGSAVAIAAGSEHSCAVMVDSTVRCWGRADASFLGRGTLTSPVLATYDSTLNVGTPLTGTVEVVAGQLHTCARMFDGTAMCWGDPSFNRLGGATGSDVAIPRPVPAVARATDLQAGRAHTCAITETNAMCWGFNLNGQLGRGDTTTGPNAVSISGVPTAMALGASHSCFAVNNLTMCTGRNTSGAFGDGATANTSVPVAIPQAHGSFSLSAGDDHSCFVGPDLSAVTRCAGIGANGRIGHGSNTNTLTPTNVQGLDFALAIAAGKAHTCALLATPGKARCWGSNVSGQLGDTTVVAKSVPTAVSVRTNAFAITAGDDHTCLLAGTPGNPAGNQLQCWGENGSGQLGIGSTTDSLAPTDVPGITPTALALGANHSCAIVPMGSTNGVKCWGSDASGQLGDDAALVNKPTPTVVAGLDGTQPEAVISLDAGTDHTCAAMQGGSLRCWGSNIFGQLGQTEGDAAATPITAEFIEDVDAVAVGNGWTCVQVSDETLQCFGRNDHGQIGYQGPTSPYPIPVAAGVTGASMIRSGSGHACVITKGALDVQCWGQNDTGQLGNDTTLDSPFKTSPLSEDFSIDVSAGTGHSCAILRDTTVRCWGANASGQIGDGTTVDRGLPTIISL